MEKFSALLTLCEGNPPVTGVFPSQKPVTWSFGVFSDQCLNKHLSKQSKLWDERFLLKRIKWECWWWSILRIYQSWCRGSTFCITKLVSGESISHRWIPLTKCQLCGAAFILSSTQTSCWMKSWVASDLNWFQMPLHLCNITVMSGENLLINIHIFCIISYHHGLCKYNLQNSLHKK